MKTPQIHFAAYPAVLGVLALASAPSAAAQATHKCSQDHPGRQHRVESVTKKGDMHMTQSVAGHVTKYAIERHGLQALVTPADIDRTFDLKTRKGQMVNFLLFKFGSPAAVMPEFIANGYEHFEKGYSDEAAAILLGILDFQKPAPDFVMPAWLAEHVKTAVKEQTKEAIAGFLESKGVPPPVSTMIGAKIGEKVSERVPVAVSLPKKFDVDNRLLELAIKAKKQASKPTVKEAAKPVPPVRDRGLPLPGGRNR